LEVKWWKEIFAVICIRYCTSFILGGGTDSSLGWCAHCQKLETNYSKL